MKNFSIQCLVSGKRSLFEVQLDVVGNCGNSWLLSTYYKQASCLVPYIRYLPQRIHFTPNISAQS